MTADLIPFPRRLRFAYFTDDKLADLHGWQRTAWGIERQLQRAHDTGDRDLVAVLLAWCPDLDESLRKDIDRLYALADVVAGSDGPAKDTARDEYVEHLRDIALTVGRRTA